MPPKWRSPHRFRDLPRAAQIILAVVFAAFAIGLVLLVAAGEIPGRSGY